MDAPANQRLTFPDGLRAIAAMSVILPHSINLFTYWTHPSLATRLIVRVSGLGLYGVQIFFVLSGFVIAYTLREQRLSCRYIGNFMLRRSIRLDPPYWAAIALFYGYIAFDRFVMHGDIVFPGIHQLLAHFFYLQDLLGYGNINFVFWTLCIEIQFYLAFCLFTWLFQFLARRLPARDRTFWERLPFIVMFAASLVYPAHLINAPEHGWFVTTWYSFLAGVIAWWMSEKSIPAWLGMTAMGLLWAVIAWKMDGRAAAVACTAGVLWLASHRGRQYSWLNIPPFQILGRWSYCIYLVHVPVIGVIVGLMVRLAPLSEVVSYLFFALIVLVTIGISALMHVWVEKPSLRLSKRLKPGQRKLAAVEAPIVTRASGPCV
jgi:peptidoglycan/LPS O-acetylase OafA/YrhL